MRLAFGLPSVQPSKIRQKLSRGETVLCAKVCYGDPELVELVSTFGFDAMWICQEHKRLDPSVLTAMINACRLQGVDALIRVKPANYTDLLWLLEAGARGIMLPRVSHVDEARAVAAAMKFPPQGIRGFDGVHAEADFGRLGGAAYMAEANRETVLVVQIEEAEVVPHIDAIAQLPGVDVLFVGPGDLTIGMGKFGQADDPAVLAILRQVVESCRRHGKVAGIPATLDNIKKYHEMGFRFFNTVSDYRLIFGGLKKLQTDLAALGFKLGSA